MKFEKQGRLGILDYRNAPPIHYVRLIQVSWIAHPF